jgi:hypothetical protein
MIIKERKHMPRKEKETKGKEDVTRIPLKWHFPDSIITRVATNMVVQRLEGGFYKLSFFETKPEIRFKEEKDQEEIPKEILAECVSSVVISPEKFPAFVDLLQRQLEINQEIDEDKKK